MKFIGFFTTRGRARQESALSRVSNAMTAPPRLHLVNKEPEPCATDREARLVRDVALLVSSKVAPIVDMHGRTLETARQANVMAVEVALRIGLEAAQRAGLCALVEGADLEQAQRKVDVAIDTLIEGLAAHRGAIAATLEAVHAGVAGGQVRPGPLV